MLKFIRKIDASNVEIQRDEIMTVDKTKVQERISSIQNRITLLQNNIVKLQSLLTDWQNILGRF